MDPSTIPELREVYAARASVYRHLHRTPLHRYAGLSERVGAELWVKHENHHAVGAFKVRGGVHLASRLDEDARRSGLYTASTGNHGQSIAFAGSVTGTPVRIAAPEGANPHKVRAMRALGAEVVLHGPDYDTAREWMAACARAEGARFIGPADRELIAGVGTYVLEIVEDLPDLDVLIVPVGAGSGACAACLVAKTLCPGVAVIGVQAAAAPAVQRSWKAGRAVEAPMETRAEGLATRVSHTHANAFLRDPDHGLDDFLLVSDEAMEQAIGILLETTRNVAEHAGAAALAAALELGERLAGKRVVVVLSGGNLASDALGRILASSAG